MDHAEESAIKEDAMAKGQMKPMKEKKKPKQDKNKKKKGTQPPSPFAPAPGQPGGGGRGGARPPPRGAGGGGRGPGGGGGRGGAISWRSRRPLIAGDVPRGRCESNAAGAMALTRLCASGRRRLPRRPCRTPSSGRPH